MLSVLLALVVSFFIVSVVLRSVKKDDTQSTGAAAAITPSTLGYNGAESGGVSVVPLGWWEDLFKIPEEIDAYGTLHAGDKNTNVSSGSYTNKAYGYTAHDDFPQFQYSYDSVNWDYTVLGTHQMFSASNADGWRYYRSYKPSPKGDYSKVSSICLDTVKPQLQVRLNGSSIAGGTVTTLPGSYFSLLGTDDVSGVASYWYKIGGGSYYECTASTYFYGDGVYSFYAKDRAGNVSDTVTVTRDTTAPAIGAYNGSAKLSSGANVGAASLRFEASDSTSGLEGLYVRLSTASGYTKYTSSVTLSTEGLYCYYARDNADNYSATYTVTLDRTAPTAHLYSGTTAVSGGYYSNASYIRFTASDTNGCTVYMKKDGGSYGVYASGTNVTAEGVYSFYAIDPAGNTTATYTITLDRAAPVGTLYAGTATFSSGKITNAAYVTYTATDAYALYVYKPNASGYVTFTSGTQFTADGTYYFYAADKSGNTSATVSVLLDKTKPVVTAYASGTTVTSGAFTNKNYVTFAASDAGSGIAGMYVRIPDSGGYISYVTGTPLSREGTYTFYATDVAGNMSDTVSVTLDTTSPVGTVTANGAQVASGSYVNTAFRYAAADSVSGVIGLEVKYPNGDWQAYDGGEIPTNGGDGLYSFRATDRAGNVSEESKVYLLTSTPTVLLYADEQPVNNGTYTNAARIAMSASGEVKAYVKLPDASGFTPYAHYYTYTAAGRYEFYAEDSAGNATDIYAVIIDRTGKPVAVNGLANGRALDNVTVTWTDGDLSTAAPIVSVTVNDVPYGRGNVLRTIDGGVYRVESTDAAGNIWTTEFTATRTEVLSQTLNKQFWESAIGTTDGAVERYAFGTYDNAFAFAKARESALIRTAVWSGSTWDGGIPMDGADSVNAENGTYYIYKKSGDKNAEVAYFTLDRLNAVIAEYAAESVKAYWWWEKAPSEIKSGNDLYGLTADRIFVGNGVTLASHANYLIDGEPYSGLTYSDGGEHILTVYDDFGNSYEYTLIIVRTAPDIYYKLSGGAFNKAADDRIYAFKEAVTLKISDALGGDFAMYIIRDTLGGVIATLSHGDGYVLSKSGRFTVQAINHGGLSLETTFVLSLDYPTITFRENGDAKRLEIRIEPSTDGGATLSETRIYKSVDSGKTWLTLDKDDYGRAVNADRLYYEFNRDGLYKVSAEDNFRSGIDAVTAEKAYLKPAPSGTLIGATDGGYTNGTVRFTWTDEANATVTFDGNTVEYKSGAELTEDGEYALTFYDGNGFEAVYTFTIKTAAPVVSIIDGSGDLTEPMTTTPVTVTYEDGCTALLYRNGTLVGAVISGAEISSDGEYEITVTDLAGNVTTVTFTLDTTPPTAELVGVTNGGSTSGAVSIRNLSEPATVAVYRNGGLIPYALGEPLTEIGSYRIVVTDTAGNATEYTFDIIYSVNTAGTVIIIIVILALIGGGVAVYLFRKRGKFKKRK
ncbi:hypothetical protein FACS1894211_09550 [Clostridia bacterium]|nr:hypothetical protein FACS1894211_09550 [Clostridia bacterium]